MRQLFDAGFETLFRHPRIAYEQGEIVWAGSWPPALMVVAVILASGIVVWSYRASRGRASPGVLRALVGIRVAGLALLLVCLLRPTLVFSTAIPQQNVVALLLDDSRSMEIRDVQGQSRAEAVRDLFVSDASPLLEELDSRFLVRPFRFSSRAERLVTPEALTFQGNRTLIGPSLDFVRQELAAVPLSAIVLVTDGGDQESGALDDAMLGLRAEGVPVHVVSTGMARIEPDVRVERVEVPRSVIRGSTLLVEAVIAHTGLGGRRVPVHLEDDGRIIASEEVDLPGSQESVTIRIPVTLEDQGVRNLRVRVPAVSGEVLTDNNHLDTQLLVRSGPEKILYFEGQPRFEVGFLRRAVRDDENIQVVVLQRTGEDRYVRLDVDDGDELSGGFPRTREELFEYRGLILGSVEAGAFTPDQLRMLAEFVDRRGGGLLVLGGPRSLAEGGYAGTALAPVLPVELSPSAREPTDELDFWATVEVAATPIGATHPAIRLAAERGSAELGEGATPGAEAAQVGVTPEGGARRWELLPHLTTVNRLGPPRPGATVLLTGSSPDLPNGGQPVFAYQRYGAGTAAILGVHDTWLWQMHHDLPLDDRTHELFWTQLLRWLVQDVPEPLQASAVRNRVAPGEPVELVARVMSEEFVRVNGAQVTARITNPFGSDETVEMQWNPERDGEYRVSFDAEIPGPYEVNVEAVDRDRLLTTSVLHIEAGVLDEELRGGAMRETLLRRIASESGGRYFTIADTDGLPEMLRYTERGSVVQEQHDLWDLPLVFLLLVGLLSAEWLLRRKEGLA